MKKGVYTLFGTATETDFGLIRQAFDAFKYVRVAIQLPIDKWGKDYRDHVSAVREGCRDLPISLDFFREGELESYLRKSGATSWLVPKHCPSDLVASVDFDEKYFMD
jgi:hypothetical protein